MDKEKLKKRTKQFAHRCVKVALVLPNNSLGKHIRYQLIRCGTSVAANYRAACIAHSRAAFAAKLSTVIEEADESEFWIQFLVDENQIPITHVETLIAEARELTSIFISSRKTIQTNS
ncbi:four helix bundle protein [Rhodohalobacter mucosus]|uniref:Four helix bundle protein n=1 Tax=Rhodohalobacter mucosus TaxID=2079485 RepID=A0A316TUC1_9BACT|nr:four helix bundle protein [Rhodohalobacter mucosus]PWN07418.1 four helix bundle protein [Rhodohalobacter mucosus]